MHGPAAHIITRRDDMAEAGTLHDDLLVAADRPEIQAAADRFRGLGADVTVLETDFATTDGVDRLWAAAAGRPVDVLLAK